MCRYCSVLAELRRKDLNQYERYKEHCKKEFIKDDVLLKRCLIALNWKENQELVEDIMKRIGGEENEL